MDFFKEFKKLVFSKPRAALTMKGSENCAYGDYITRSKNIYVSYFVSDSIDIFYSEQAIRSRDCIDCSYVAQSELCYECVDSSGLYNCSYLQDCHNGSNLNYCLDCTQCKDCFGCFGLRHQQFRIFNKPYSEQEYRKKVLELKKNTPEKILEILKPEFDRHPRLYARQLKGGENSFGDYIYFSKNCFQCYQVRNITDCGYMEDAIDPEVTSNESYDCTYGMGMDLCYECFDVQSSSNCNFLISCTNCSDSQYLIHSYNCQNCFGCAYLINKQFCILNRQFTEEEYRLALAKIKEEMKVSGTYGKTLAEILSQA